MSLAYSDQSQISPVATETTLNHSDYHDAINGSVTSHMRNDSNRLSSATANRRSIRSEYNEHHNTSDDRMMRGTRISQQSTKAAAFEPTFSNSDNQVPQAEPLLDHEKPLTILSGWPTSPKPIKTGIYIKLLNGVFDVLLLTCSAAFLAFALIVSIYDQTPTADNPRLTKTLIDATKYV
jgi:hypothetical protein